MADNTPQADRADHKRIWFPEARIYYSREAERRFFFFMTLGMAVLGLAVKFGLI